GAEFAFEKWREARDIDLRLKPVGIDLARRGMKQHVDVFLFQQRAVAREVARVGGEVLARRELRWVDEERDDDAVAELFRRADEGEMAFVQRAHRGNERDAPARGPLGFAPTPHLLYRLDDAHGLKFQVNEKPETRRAASGFNETNARR